MRANERRVAVGFIRRQLVAAGIVELQILADTPVKGQTRLAAHLILENAHQVRHGAEDIGRCGNHAGPSCTLFFEAIKRTRVVVKSLREKLQLLPLDYGIAVAQRIELRALREVCRVAGHAERRLLVHARHTVQNAAAARRVGCHESPAARM